MKIYGMRGLLEWHGTVHSKGLRMKVDFTNGSVTAFGVAPATFITSDTMTQAIMENSDEFKSGRIRLERTVPLPGEVDERVVDGNENEIGNGEPAVDGGEPALDSDATDKVDARSENGGDGEPAVDGGVRKVEVTDKSNAIEWLKEHYPEKGYTATKLRTNEAFNAACAECNVEFAFTN